jgi:hypothetical protein
MPNWCECYVKIKGEVDLIKDLYDKIKEKQEFLNILQPRPEDQEDNWYEWNVNNWGTKWDLTEDQISELEYTKIDSSMAKIEGYIMTAWAPPLDAFDNYIYDVEEEYDCEKEVDIKCIYWEPGMGFAGMYHNGDDVCERYGDMKKKEIIKNETLQEVEEAFSDFTDEIEEYCDEE